MTLCFIKTNKGHIFFVISYNKLFLSLGSSLTEKLLACNKPILTLLAGNNEHTVARIHGEDLRWLC